MTQLADYQDRYSSFAQLRRDERGIIEVVLHTDGGSLVWNETAHRQLPELFADIGADFENRLVLLTGAGPDFCCDEDMDSFPPFHSTAGFDKVYWEGKRLFTSIMDVEVPIVAAVNGRATVHSEIALLSDIVIASDTAVFQDSLHTPHGKAPADGVQILWPLLIGLNRAKYFLLMAEEIAAKEAKELGIVSEIVPLDGLRDRAWDIARQLADMPTLGLRYTRVVLNQHLRERLLSEVGYGLMLQGAAIAAMGDEH